MKELQRVQNIPATDEVVNEFNKIIERLNELVRVVERLVLLQEAK